VNASDGFQKDYFEEEIKFLTIKKVAKKSLMGTSYMFDTNYYSN